MPAPKRKMIKIGLVLLTVLAGCAAYVETGPDPAYLKVNLQAMVSDEQIHQTMSANFLYYPTGGGGYFHNINGPYWDWGAYLLGEDGSLKSLRPVERAFLYRVGGKTLNTSATFALPPGNHRVRILAEAYLENNFYESDGYMPARPSSEPVHIAGFNQDIKRNFHAGETIVINPHFNK